MKLFRRKTSSSAPEPSPSPEPRRVVVAAPAVDSEPPRRRLISSHSPASEWPTTWRSYNALYAAGQLDFENPPPPPHRLDGVESMSVRTETGVLLAPTPLCEIFRQRTVDASDYPKCPQAGLQLLVEEAASKFHTSIASISIMDGDEQVFLANKGMSVSVLKRANTACSHATVKSSTGSREAFVLCDLSKDFRFETNDFAGARFYASAPIYGSVPLGDSPPEPLSGSAVLGLLCLLDPKPRSEFTEEDRQRLRQMADEAGKRLQEYKEERRIERALWLQSARQKWLGDPVVQAYSDLTAERGPRLAGSAVHEPPVYLKSKGTVSMGARFRKLPADGESTFYDTLNLSAQLLTESTGMTFSYIALLGPFELLVTYNLPQAPYFSQSLHTQVRRARPVIYYSSGVVVEGEATSGAIFEVGDKVIGGRTRKMLLGSFTDQPSRSFTASDFFFLSSFAIDLGRILEAYMGEI